jgi:tetratricopeptide (TPR) repeat protein
MHQYGVGDVERLLRISKGTLRSLVNAGFVSPARGERNTWRFSFQDLIVLRTAQALVEAHVPQRRITHSLKRLRGHLPESMPLSGLSIGAVGDRVVVKEGAARWQADSGQYLLAFEGDPAAGLLNVVDQPRPSDIAPEDMPTPFEKAVFLEQVDEASAIRAYEAIIADDPSHLDARVNLGRVLHEAGRYEKAERVYRDALDAFGDDAILYFNLAVLLEERSRVRESMQAYEAALRVDPEMADAHYNLSLIFRKIGRARDALRHMGEYRRLSGS